jgi:hypothetical protein
VSSDISNSLNFGQLMDQAGWVPLQNGHVGRDCNPKTVSIKVDFCWTNIIPARIQLD